MAPTPHPSPAKGVFETLLVVDGQAVELDAHLRRLAASLSTLYGARMPAEAPDSISQAARQLDLGRLRMTAIPAPGAAIRLQMDPAEIDRTLIFPTQRVLALCTVSAPDGLGAHKWADRSLLERMEESASAEDLRGEGPSAEETVPLLIDRDGSVLEASRANLFAVREGALMTPPLDGRILPGIARARVIEVAAAAGLQIRETELSLPDLLSAAEVFLTGSVRGVEPVRAIDGTALQTGGEVTQLVARELRRRWFD